MFFLKSYIYSKKKAPGRAAPHRISEWGCSNKLFLPESKDPDIHILALIRMFAECVLAADS